MTKLLKDIILYKIVEDGVTTLKPTADAFRCMQSDKSMVAEAVFHSKNPVANFRDRGIEG